MALAGSARTLTIHATARPQVVCRGLQGSSVSSDASIGRNGCVQFVRPRQDAAGDVDGAKAVLLQEFGNLEAASARPAQHRDFTVAIQFAEALGDFTHRN